ncbi:MAG: hypothetical protein B6I22_03525 [Desulfobacteraceae bacterium 4572_123]|nr:MAG: hypothetical protein B6I22_03525 [Desulfobacteraceae bacterium 4572_123]
MNGYWISAERNLYGQCEIMTEIFSGNIESGRLKPLTISIVSAVLTGLSYGFGIYLFPMVMPEMLKDLHLNYTHAGTITGVGQVSALLTIPPAGYLTGRIGGLRLILLCPLIGACLLAAMYYVKGFYGLMILNFIIRGWPIMVWIPLVAIAAEHIDVKWRATMLTASSSGACFFIFIDGVISSYFLAHYHWRNMWLFVSGLCLIVVVVCFLALKGVNAWEIIKYGAGPASKPTGDILKWIKTRSGIALNLLFALAGFAFVAFQMYLAPFLRDELGLGLEITGVMWAVMGISGIIGGVGIGVITDRMGARISFAIVFAMAVISTVLICLPMNFLTVLTMAVLFGVGQAAVFGLHPAYLSKTMSADLAAKAFSVGNMVMISSAVAGNFIGGWSGGETGSFLLFYIALGGLFLLGVFVSFCLKNEKYK